MKRLFMLLCAVVAFAACEQAPIEEAQGVVMSDRNLEVSFEGGDDTRIQLQNGKTVWTKGDHVSVFYRSSVNEEWQFMGETGDRTGQIVPVDNSVNPPATHNHVVVAYPYRADYFYNTETHNVEASLPAVQSYLKDSYGTNGNIMISSSEFNKVSLKSVCGWLKLQLTGDGEVVKSITLRGNDGEQVAGLIYVDSATATATLASASGEAGDGEVGGTLVRPGTILTEVTLDCGEGVTLGAEATAFYIALPPQTFEQGLMVDVNCGGYCPMSISTQNVVTIERNHIQPMSEVEFSSEVRTIANNEIWYTAKEKIEDAQWTYDTFGANIVSHEWDSTTGEGIISFDDDIAIIGDNAFYENENLTSVTFNNSLKNIGRSAFQGCSSLTEVTIPGNIEEVGYWSFADCLNLTQINIEKGDGQLWAFYAFDNVAANLYVDRDLEGGFLNYPFSDAKLTSITIGPNMKHIEECVFGYCEELQSLNFDQNSQVETIGRYAFVASNIPCVVHIPESVVEIDPSAFALTTGIKAFTSDSPYYSKGAYGELCCDSTLFRCTGTVVEMWISYDNIGDWSCCGSNIEKVITYTNPGALRIGDYAFWKCSKLAVMEPYGSYMNMNISSIGDGVFGYTAIEALNFLKSTFTSINGTFRQCEALQSLYLPASLTEIGERSFEDCKNLTSLYIAAPTPPTLSSDAFNVVADELKIYVPFESLNAYRTNWSEYSDRFVAYDFENGVVVEVQPNNEIWYTSSDGNVVTPNRTYVFGVNIVSNTYNNGKGVITFDGDVTTIGDYAFTSCTSLTSVTIGDGVTEIGDGAFSSCDSLTSVNIPDSVTTIGIWVFSNCTSLTSVNIPDSVTTIGECAFRSCNSLKEFTGKFAEDNGRILVIDGVLTAFVPAGITEYNIPDSVTEIGNGAFWGCESLISVNIPDSVTEIGSSAFNDCTSLTSVNIPNSVTTIGKEAFADCTSLTSVNIPDSVTEIGSSAFWGCESLTSVNIGDSVTTIGNAAFADCTSLTSVNIPNSVTTIGGRAFDSCDSLTSVTIGDSVTTIGNYAFYSCYSLISVYCKATTPPVLYGYYVFENNGSGRKIYVPAGSVNAYKSAEYWSEYADAIVGYDFENDVVVE